MSEWQGIQLAREGWEWTRRSAQPSETLLKCGRGHCQRRAWAITLAMASLRSRTARTWLSSRCTQTRNKTKARKKKLQALHVFTTFEEMKEIWFSIDPSGKEMSAKNSRKTANADTWPKIEHAYLSLWKCLRNPCEAKPVAYETKRKPEENKKHKVTKGYSTDTA